MRWLLLSLGLAFASQIWLSWRVGRSNGPLAIATFFIGFPAALYTFFKHRGDEETSVTKPFVANIVLWAVFLLCVWQILLPLLDAQAAEFEKSIVGAAPAALPASAPRAAASAVQAASAAEPASAASAAAALVDPIDAFATALRALGLQPTVTRLTDPAQLPPDVSDAALFSVAGLASSSASAPAAASAPASGELSATLFKCESAAACRNLAGIYMQQSGPDKRRVLQNGLLLLSMLPSVPNDPDLTPAAVASVFRKL
jgi:hypothetical protein